MKPIYEPKGAAKEYGDYALNIYTGCPHRCYYCFAPSVLRREKEFFHSNVEPRAGIVEETRKQLERDESLRNKLIHLCFTCDPYPTGYDTSVTREIIKLLKAYGNHVQILTKGDGSRDFDLLDENDWYGVTYDGTVDAEDFEQIGDIAALKQFRVNTWISCEPVIDADNVVRFIEECYGAIDKLKIGKLNYHPSDINWKEFGEKAENLCKEIGINYYIKDSLRKEMEK